MSVVETRLSIGTDRLVLRAPRAGDALMLADFGNDIGVAGMTASMPHPFGVAEAEACLAKVAGGDPKKRAGFVIEHRQFGPIGLVQIHEKQPRRPELGAWLGRPFWGRGYATEAVSAALGWVRSDWKKNVVWAGHFADNRAAGQVLCKAGFLYTGDVEVRGSAAREGAGVRTRMMVWLA